MDSGGIGGWINGCTGRCMGGWIGGRVDEWIGGLMD